MNTADIIPFASKQSAMSETPTTYDAKPAGACDTDVIRRKGAQLENGFTQIANELVERLSQVNMTCYESRVLWAVFRKTYGWNKPEDRITGSQFAAATGLHPVQISNTVNKLIERKVLFRKGGKFGKIGLNTRFWEWKDDKNRRGENLTVNDKFTGELNGDQLEELNGDRLPQYITTENKEEANASSSDEAKKNTPKPGKPKKRKQAKQVFPNTPYDEITSALLEECPTLPRFSLSLSDKRKAAIRKCWQKGFTTKRVHEPDKVLYTDLESGIAWWRQFFFWVDKNCAWLRESHCFTVDWVFDFNNLLKIMEGNYDKRRGAKQ